MKFTWFNLMPWPDLPDDFRETNRSVWVDIDQKLFDPARSHEVYNTYMDLLEYASTVGFDGIGVNEHHQNGYGIMPSPNIIAAGLARRTKDAAIVVLGNSIALYNPPVRVAEEFAMLDCISGGRLVAGFPVNGLPVMAILHYQYGADVVKPFIRIFPAGAFGICLFNLVASVCLVPLGLVATIALAYGVDIAFLIAVSRLGRPSRAGRSS